MVKNAPAAPVWRRLLVLLVLAALAGAACGDSSDDGGDGAPADETADDGAGADETTDEDDGEDDGESALPDPCGLLTAADYQSATGHPFGEGVFNEGLSAPDRRICDWTSDDPFATGQVLVAPGETFEESRPFAEEISGGPVVDVEVAGADAAYHSPEGSIVAMLIGDVFVQVSYIPPGPGEVTEITLGLAAIAAANL